MAVPLSAMNTRRVLSRWRRSLMRLIFTTAPPPTPTEEPLACRSDQMTSHDDLMGRNPELAAKSSSHLPGVRATAKFITVVTIIINPAVVNTLASKSNKAGIARRGRVSPIKHQPVSRFNYVV